MAPARSRRLALTVGLAAGLALTGCSGGTSGGGPSESGGSSPVTQSPAAPPATTSTAGGSPVAPTAGAGQSTVGTVTIAEFCAAYKGSLPALSELADVATGGGDAAMKAKAFADISALAVTLGNATPAGAPPELAAALSSFSTTLAAVGSGGQVTDEQSQTLSKDGGVLDGYYAKNCL